MSQAFAPIIALLLGTAFLLAGSGLHGLLLPLRGQAEGFSTTSLGLLGTAWAGGFVAGCYFAPRLVRRVGHVRAFGAFASLGAIIALMTGLVVNETIWVILRVSPASAWPAPSWSSKAGSTSAPPTKTVAP